MRKKVLVLGNDNRSFLSVVRSLGRKGVEVHVAWYPQNIAALRSKYIAKKQLIPPPYSRPNSWQTPFINMVSRENYDLIIPCNDESIIPLYSIKNEISRYAKLYLLDSKTHQIFFDKWTTFKLARELDINLPKGILCNDAKQANLAANHLGFPLVIKPLCSFYGDDLKNRNKVKKAFSREQLNALLNTLFEGQSVIIQKNFIGQGVGVEVLAHEGEVLVAFQHERVHEPIHGGGSSYRKGVRINSELMLATKKLVAATNYTGVGMFEYKINPNGKDWILVEVNARFWGSLPLAIASGMDFPFWLFELLVNGRNAFEQRYKLGLYCRNWTDDFYWQIHNLKSDKNNPALATKPLLKVLGEFKNFLLLRERSDTFTWDDPCPGMAEMWTIWRQIFKSVAKAIKLKWIRTKIAKRIARKRIQICINDNPNMLFVCKGNIIRSPFAEYYLSKYHPDLGNFLSAGYAKQTLRLSPKIACKAARKYGVHLESHRSHRITNDDVNWSGVILVFDWENLQRLRNTYPSARSKIFMLGAFLGDNQLEINDPCCGTLDDFKTVYHQISTALECLYKYLHSSE